MNELLNMKYLIHSSCIQTLVKKGFNPTLKSINLLLLFLSKTRRYSLITHLFSQIIRNQFIPNTQTHSIYTWALLKLNKFEEAEHFIKTQLLNPPCRTATRPIWDSLIRGFCVDRKEPDKALGLLQDCVSSYGMLPSSFTLCSLICGFSARGNMSAAMAVFELMNGQKVNHPLDNFVCSSIISGFCKIGKAELGVDFFENAYGARALRPNVVTYTALVSALCMLGRVNEVYDLVCRMETEGLAFDVVFYSSWIHGCFQQGMLMEAFQKNREMIEKGIDSDAISFTILMDGFSKAGNVERAAGFLDKMLETGLNPNLVTCTVIVMGFSKKGKMDEAFAVFKKLEDIGIEADEFIYAVLVDGVCRIDDFDRAYQLLEEMKQKGISPGTVTYNTLINGLCKIGRTSDAHEVAKGIVGDVVTYSTLLHGYIVEENIEGILETKRRFEKNCCGMDNVMCNVLIRALFMVGEIEAANALYRRMHEAELVADSVTFCTIIDEFCKVGRIDEALKVFDEFRRTSISSGACYNCMVNGLCKNGTTDIAAEVFIELTQKGFILDSGVCKTLLWAIIKEEHAEGVLNLLYKIENLGLALNDTIFNYAIILLCKWNFPMGATEISLVMRRNNLLLTSKSYHTILKRLINGGNLWQSQLLLSTFIKEYGIVEPKVVKTLLHYLCMKDVNAALYFLNKIKGDNPHVTFPVSALKALTKSGRALAAYDLVMGAYNLPVIDMVDYSIIIHGLCKRRQPLKALDLCAFAEKKGITFNIISYNSIINELCRQGCLVEAFRLFDSLVSSDLAPSKITYVTLIDNLSKEGYLADAKRLFERMLENGYQENTRAYNSLINGYCKFGMIEEAVKLLSDMERLCLNADEFTISSVINGYCQKGDMEEALRFYSEHSRKGASPDFLGFLYLIRGLCAKGRMEEARTILREMLQSQSVVELISKVDTEVETESIGSFVAFLCEQGSIKEAVAVLNEVGSVFFPGSKASDPYRESQEQHLQLKEEGLPKAVSTPTETDLEFGTTDVRKVDNMVGSSGDSGMKSQLNCFDSYYPFIASLCLRGDLTEANKLAKGMLACLDEDC